MSELTEAGVLLVQVQVNFCFSSSIDKNRFLNIFNGQDISITSVEDSGSFAGKLHELPSVDNGEEDTADSKLNDLSDQLPHPTVTGNINLPKADSPHRHSDSDSEQLIKEKEVQHRPISSTLEAINLIEKENVLDNFNEFSSPSDLLESEQIDIVPAIERYTDTFSNTTMSQSNGVVPSVITSTVSHSSSSSHILATKPASSKISTGVPMSEKAMTCTESSEVTNAIELTKKRRHTLFCLLHGTEVSVCKFYSSPLECYHSYDEQFANGIRQLLNKEQCDSTIYDMYIVDHLQNKMCPSTCGQLWKYCLTRKLYGLLLYADEGLLIYSEDRKPRIGTVCKEYYGYKNLTMIGEGGLGTVYKHTVGPKTLALKEERKRPLIAGEDTLFQRILRLEHKHVIKVLEYAKGPRDEGGALTFLCVMPFMNQRGLHKQFDGRKNKCTCVLDYMHYYQERKEFVFRNYTVLFRHIFEGLCYLKNNGIVHRDIKTSNILGHQNCQCPGPLLCKCPGDGGVVYALGDLDLLCREGESGVWDKMVRQDPAGTVGMKPPESFFRTVEGDPVITHLSDVWSGCVTMMNVLVGKEANLDSQTQISEFLKASAKCAVTASQGVDQSVKLLDRIYKKHLSVQGKLKASSVEVANNEMDELTTNLVTLKKLLGFGKVSLQRMHSFQGEQKKRNLQRRESTSKDINYCLWGQHFALEVFVQVTPYLRYTSVDCNAPDT